MQFDALANLVSQRTDFWFSGTNTEITFLKASADRSAIGIVAGDISSGPVFKYITATDVFTHEKDLNAFVSFVSLNRNGSTVLVNPGTYVLDTNLTLSGTVPGGGSGGAIDPAGAIGYQVNGAQIDVLDLADFSKTGSLTLGDTTSNATNFGTGVGRMAISRDGSLVAVITDHGVAVVKAQRLSPTASIPTLDKWALWLLGLLVLIVGAHRRKRA